MNTLITQYPAGMMILALSSLVVVAAAIVVAVLKIRAKRTARFETTGYPA